MSWLAIIRLGFVQSAIGAMVMLSTSLLNRIMVVEYALPAALPAGLVAWHYGVQLARPVWGHGSDKGRRRTPWIIGGMGLLVLGTLLAVAMTVRMPGTGPMLGAIAAFALIGGGVGAAGTSLLALLATQTAPDRRAAAAAMTWIMMIVGIIVTAGVAGSLIDPFSPARLALVVAGVGVTAFLVTVAATWGVEAESRPMQENPVDFRAAVADMMADRGARIFTLFVFVSMLAYSMQDMILEPFAGLMFGMTPGQSTQLTGVQHMGVLAGMILVGVGGRAFGAKTAGGLRSWTVAGCIGSSFALAGLALSARYPSVWPLKANVALLGFCNGVFAVSAIAAMMALAGAGGPNREGVRMGVWGASQAIAFGIGGLTGAVGVDVGRSLMHADAPAFTLIFSCEAALFLLAASIALRAVASRAPFNTTTMAGAI
jgi:MFS transporter, BCD family, chlorophyll transporter